MTACCLCEFSPCKKGLSLLVCLLCVKSSDENVFLAVVSLALLEQRALVPPRTSSRRFIFTGLRAATDVLFDTPHTLPGWPAHCLRVHSCALVSPRRRLAAASAVVPAAFASPACARHHHASIDWRKMQRYQRNQATFVATLMPLGGVTRAPHSFFYFTTAARGVSRRRIVSAPNSNRP